MNTDPDKTLALLVKLEALGFGDDAFSLLHHFKNHTISEHRKYCLDLGTFKDDGENSEVQRRLEIVLAAYKAAALTNSRAFPSLAHAALVEIPLRGPQRDPW